MKSKSTLDVSIFQMKTSKAQKDSLPSPESTEHRTWDGTSLTNSLRPCWPGTGVQIPQPFEPVSCSSSPSASVHLGHFRQNNLDTWRRSISRLTFLSFPPSTGWSWAELWSPSWWGLGWLGSLMALGSRSSRTDLPCSSPQSLPYSKYILTIVCFSFAYTSVAELTTVESTAWIQISVPQS